ELAIQHIRELVGDGGVFVAAEAGWEHELDHHQSIVVDERALADGGARDWSRRGNREGQDEEKEDPDVCQGQIDCRVTGRDGSAVPRSRAICSSWGGSATRTFSSPTFPSRPVAPPLRSASTTSVTRTSGADAPAVTPMRLAPSSHSRRTSRMSLIRYARVPVDCETSTSRMELELLAAPMTSRTSTSPATVFTAA